MPNSSAHPALVPERFAEPLQGEDKKLTMDAVVTPRDRLSFTVFLAAAMHAAMILGIGFAWHVEHARAPTIEVTLARHDDRTAPDHADFLAQANQIGSGDSREIRETTTTEESAFHDNVLREVASEPQVEANDAKTPPTLTTASASEFKTQLQTPQPDVQPRLTPADQRKLMDLSQEIASLEARIDTETNTNARMPRVRRLTSVSARQSDDAYYLQSWARKVEAVGNLNYPEEARKDRLYGSLRMLVTIAADGTLKDVKILESSGYQVLDDAALRIVKMSAPFAPLPPQMLANTDLVEIIRTWQFRKNHYSSS